VSETLIDPLIGRLVDGRYEVRERVANGGMATVYLAFDKRLERNIALKVMHTSLAEGADAKEFVSRFRREAKAAARLTHPGAVRVYDQGVDSDLPYLTMEFVDGENLRERIGHEGTLTVGEALTITESVLDALTAAHRQGLIHRDVKPENVLIDADGRPRVADFGLARAVTEVTSTSTGVIMGTVAYLAPELVTRGFSDARTDIYAVGVLLFEMVTGRQPFTGASAIDVAARHVHEDVPAPSGFAPWLPTEFDDLVASLAARDPESRPADAAAALAMVRTTRSLMDDPTLDRRADPPSGAIALADADPDATTVIDTVQSGATVALPIGIGRVFPAVELFEAELVDGDPEAEEPEVPQHRAWWWLGAILAVAVFLGGATLWWYNAVGPGAYTTVPPVADTDGSDAQNVLESKGFVVVVNHDYSDSVPIGVVISSSPKDQARVENGATVTLLVSLGVEQVEVPPVVGSTEGEAKAALKDAGFPIGDVTPTYDDATPKGQVMSSTPAAGERVDHNTPVALEVSSGPAPIVIPDVVGKTEAEARAVLTGDAYGLGVTVQHERDADTPKGDVIRQDPEADADGLRKDTVTIWISDGPPLITVSDYVGLKVRDAEKAAKADGLNVSLYGKWPWSTKKSIVDQSMIPGSQVEQGSTITLTYN